jgi:glycosyltransferase involved in cell wall biosynthesis
MTATDNRRQPLVSFIVTCYNLPTDMLCECIDSILKLNLQSAEREIIVVDDGSDQSPMNDLLKYGDDIIYVRQKNGGVSVARNTAMDMAKGQFIQIVDGDDYLLTVPYEQCLDIIRKNSDADVVMFDFTHQNSQESNPSGNLRKKSGPDLLRTENIQGAACCCLFRQTVRGHLAFTPGIAYGEDEEFTPQLLIRAEMVYVTDAKAYFYRERETSAVHQKDESSIQKRLSDTKEVILHLNQLADTRPQSDKVALQRRVAQLTMDYIYNTILLTRSEEKLNETLEDLRKDGLFPLPDHPYSTKYTWFRRLSNNTLGRKMLLRVLPLMKKER